MHSSAQQGRISQSTIDAILPRIDILEVIDRLLPLRKSGKEYVACCPFHAEKSPSFTVSQSKQFYHCFGCGAHGNAINFLIDFQGISFREAVTALADQVGVTVEFDGGGKVVTDAAEGNQTEEVIQYAAKLFAHQLKGSGNAVSYLKGRGISGESARKFRIGYSGGDELSTLLEACGGAATLLAAGLVSKSEDGRLRLFFRNRVIFPIMTERGRIIGFGGRALTESAKAKYLNSPESPLFHKGSILYGLYQATDSIRKTQSVVVVEGYFDVISLHQNGVTNAVAPLGTALTLQQATKLVRLACSIIVCLDGDASGRKAACRAAEIFLEVTSDDRQISFVFLPNEHDPDSFIMERGPEGWNAYVKEESLSLSELVMEMSGVTRGLNPENAAKAAAVAMDFLRRIKNAPMLKRALKRTIESRLGFELGDAPSDALVISKESRARQEEKVIKPQDISAQAVRTMIAQLGFIDPVSLNHLDQEILDEESVVIVKWFSFIANGSSDHEDLINRSGVIKEYLLNGKMAADLKKKALFDAPDMLEKEVATLLTSIRSILDSSRKKTEIMAAVSSFFTGADCG